MISVSAMSEKPMRGPVSTIGRCPAVSCRTRLDTTLTSNCWLGITLKASSRRELVIRRRDMGKREWRLPPNGHLSIEIFDKLQKLFRRLFRVPFAQGDALEARVVRRAPRHHFGVVLEGV